MALAWTVIAASDLPGLPLVGLELGSTPAFAKNDRNADRERGNRGRGHEVRQARSDAQNTGGGRRVWNRPGRQNGSDNGRHLGHDKTAASVADERRTMAARLESPPLPPHRPDAGERAFRNHGDRVSTFVALAKAVGLGASTGAQQANFGTPFENALVATDPDTGEFLKDPDTGQYIIDATEDEIAAVKPGNGPKTGWETETRMDVNMDGVVDRADLELALGNGPPPDYPDHDGESQAVDLRLGRQDGSDTF